MIVLDTDHLSVLGYPTHAHAATLIARMEQSGERDFTTSIVTVEEQLRGWLSLINRVPDVHKQIAYYDRLITRLAFLGGWKILSFDTRAANEFKRLRRAKVRIGKMDLKIASIALVQDALLLSANLRDFRQVPGLEVENWLG
jgi:tRNA(fMet)-specific endonuclease VapC